MVIRKFAELIDVDPQTLRNWDKLGKLKPDYVNPDTGYRYYSEEQFGRTTRQSKER